MSTLIPRLRVLCVPLLVLCLLCPAPAGAYSVLSHEEVVDMAWLPHIVPLLRARFPNLTDDQIKEAHAYAYGGSVIQDIGYYPFGSHEFSDLLHYVRTGDFVSALIRESTNPDEYAFALGALAHYCGDVVGHPAVNKVTASEYPKLRQRFGPVVTYDEDKTAHIRTEFGFDVAEVAHGRYSQQNYRDFIGFQVSKDVMERAFEETYGIPLNSIMKHEDLAIGSYRRAVSGLIPKMTTVALVNYKDQIEKEDPGFDHKKFIYRLSRTEYEKDYGTQYAHPGVGSRVLAFVFSILPKVGPLKIFALKVPDPADQDAYIKSINGTVDKYNGYLSTLQSKPSTAKPFPAPQTAASAPNSPAPNSPTPNHSAPHSPSQNSSASTAAPNSPTRPKQTPDGNTPAPASATVASTPDLSEIDLDTGKPSELGEYRLADQTYAKLLDTLVHDPAHPIPPDVRKSLEDFYAKRNQPAWYAKKRKDWQRLQADLTLFDATPQTPATNAAE